MTLAIVLILVQRGLENLKKMKPIMKAYIFLLPLMLLTLGCASQKKLVTAISESRNNEWGLSYIDSSGNIYNSWGVYGGLTMTVIFSRIEFNKETSHLKIEGLTTTPAMSSDTIGLCCVDYFIAQPVNGYLTNIRKMGRSNSTQTGDGLKADGYFSFDIILDKKDRLYFVNTENGGLQEYAIGKVCNKTESIVRH